MNDALDVKIAQGQAEADAARKEQLLAAYEAWHAKQAKAPAAGSGDQESPSIPMEAGKAITGGLMDAVTGSYNSYQDLVEELGRGFMEARKGFGSNISDTVSTLANPVTTIMGAAQSAREAVVGKATRGEAPKVLENQTTGGKMARGLVQFATPALVYMRTLKAAGQVSKLGTFLRGLTAGGIVDATVQAPTEKNLSNLLLDMGYTEPRIVQPVAEFLRADPEDSQAFARFKKVIEGAALGSAAEAAVKAITVAYKAVRYGGKDPALKKMMEEAEKAQGGAKEAPAQSPEAAPAQATPSPAPEAAQAASPQVKEASLPASERIKEVRKREQAKALRKNQQPAPASPQEPIPLKTSWEAAEARAAEPASRKVYLDEASSEVIWTKDAPTPGAIPLDDRVKAALEKSPFERTAQDLVALRAYSQLQEQAFPGIIKPGPRASVTSQEAIQIVESRARKAQGRKAVAEQMGDAVSAKIEEPALPVPEELMPKPAGWSPMRAAGETVEYYGKDGEVLTGILRKVLPSGKVVVEDAATGAIRTGAIAGDIADTIKANGAAISQASGSQGGFVSTNVLMHMASGSIGGTAGASQIDEDDTLAEKLGKIGLGVLAGLGVSVGGAKVLTPQRLKALEEADPVISSLARDEVQGVAPVADIAAARKVAPVVQAAKVQELADRLASGQGQSLADLVSEADFNFAYIDDAASLEEAIQATSATFAKEIDAAKRGVVPFADIEAAAREVGAEPGQLAEDLFAATDKLAERTLALRSMVASSGKAVTNLARMVLRGEGGLEAATDNILALRKQVALHAALQARMKGVQTETARALSQYRIVAKSVEMTKAEREELLRQLGGLEANSDLARLLDTITDPEKLNAVARRGSEANTWDAMYEAYVNGLLSGPVTHVANIIGNSITAIGSVAEKYGAAGIGLVLRSDVDRVTFKEANAYVLGLTSAVRETLWLSKDGLRELASAAGDLAKLDLKGAHGKLLENPLYKAFATGESSSAMSRPDAISTGGAFAADTFTPALNVVGLDARGWAGQMVNGLGAVVRAPGKALAAADEFFWALNYRGEMTAQAYREALSKGLEGDAFAREVARLIDDPTEGMRVNATKAAREGTFTAELGKGGRALQQAVSYVPGARYIMPFVRTPVNIIKYAGTRSPLQLANPTFWADVSAGGARQQAALSKVAIGTSILMASYEMASNGITTTDGTRYRLVGGGERKRQAETIGGQLPYALEVTAPDGSTSYLGFNRLDPLGMQLGWAADLADIAGKADESTLDEMAAMGAIAVSRNLVEKSYLSGLADFLEAVQDPDRKMQKWINNHMASRVPALINTIRKEEDGHQKLAWTAMDAIKGRMAFGVSEEVPNAVNIWGEDVETPKALGPEWLSPIYQSNGSPYPAAKEIARLNIDIQMPPKAIPSARGAPSVALNAKQYRRMMQLIGQGNGSFKGFKEVANELVQSPSYQALPEALGGDTAYQSAKERRIRMAWERTKERAVKALLREDADLAAKVSATKRNASLNRRGRELIPTEQ